MGNCISLNGRTEIAASASASAPLQSLAPHSSSSDVEMEEDTPVFPPFEGLDMALDGSDYDPDDDASNGDDDVLDTTIGRTPIRVPMSPPPPRSPLLDVPGFHHPLL